MGWAENEVIEVTLRFDQLGDNCFATRNRGNQNLKTLGGGDKKLSRMEVPCAFGLKLQHFVEMVGG